MDKINDRDETLMSICVETQGRFELGPESGEPNENFVFAKLSQAGYTSSSSASVDERVVPSLEFLYRLAYPERGQNQPINEMQPDYLKLAPVIRKMRIQNLRNRG